MKRAMLEQERVIINVQETLKAVLLGMERMQGQGQGGRDKIRESEYVNED